MVIFHFYKNLLSLFQMNETKVICFCAQELRSNMFLSKIIQVIEFQFHYLIIFFAERLTAQIECADI